MGYTTHVSGELTIEPPLTWAEIKDTPYVARRHEGGVDLVLTVDEESVTTPEGELTRRTASTLQLREIDEYRAYTLLDDVQRAVDAFPGHTWTGHLHCEGEDNDDIWRVAIHDGRAVKVEPRIVWPDDTED